MPYPNPYNVTYSYSGFATGLGDGSFPGPQVDNDFATLSAALLDLNNFVRGFTRADGKLANRSVGADQLDTSITVGFGVPTTWEPDVPYTTKSTVFHDGKFWLANVNHSSATFNEAQWNLIVDFADGAGPALETYAYPLAAPGWMSRTTKDRAGDYFFAEEAGVVANTTAAQDDNINNAWEFANTKKKQLILPAGFMNLENSVEQRTAEGRITGRGGRGVRSAWSAFPTQLIWTGAPGGKMFVLDPDGTELLRGPSIENMSLNGNSIAGVQGIVANGRVPDGLINDVGLRNLTDGVVLGIGSTGWELHRAHAYTCTGVGFDLLGDNHFITFLHCRSSGVGAITGIATVRAGSNVDGLHVSNVNLFACDWEARAVLYQIDAVNVRGLAIMGGYMEHNTNLTSFIRFGRAGGPGIVTGFAQMGGTMNGAAGTAYSYEIQNVQGGSVRGVDYRGFTTALWNNAGTAFNMDFDPANNFIDYATVGSGTGLTSDVFGGANTTKGFTKQARGRLITASASLTSTTFAVAGANLSIDKFACNARAARKITANLKVALTGTSATFRVMYSTDNFVTSNVQVGSDYVVTAGGIVPIIDQHTSLNDTACKYRIEYKVAASASIVLGADSSILVEEVRN